MTTDLRFDFVVDRAASTLTTQREFAAARPLVWDCHTQSHLLDRWFAPKPLTTQTKLMDFRAGGTWHYAMVEPGGREHWGRFDYLAIDPIDGYAARDGFCDVQGTLDPNLPRSRWDVTFTDVRPVGASPAEGGDRTLVQTVVSYTSAEDIDRVIAMGMRDGLTSTLERLDELLLTLKREKDLA